jgi:DNA-binding CsgD family transcriptional regulator
MMDNQMNTFYRKLSRWFSDNVLIVSLFIIQLTVSVWDMTDDVRQNISSSHVSNDVLFALFSLLGLLILSWKLHAKDKVLAQLSDEISGVKSTLGQQQEQAAKLMGELSEIIHRQFDAWQLSDAEKEVALLLLKGLSLEEIAAVRGRAEKTVRQQASAVYNKAGIAGRHALSAYFFEDLLGK